jgi:hypothetical protein
MKERTVAEGEDGLKEKTVAKERVVAGAGRCSFLQQLPAILATAFYLQRPSPFCHPDWSEA